MDNSSFRLFSTDLIQGIQTRHNVKWYLSDPGDKQADKNHCSFACCHTNERSLKK